MSTEKKAAEHECIVLTGQGIEYARYAALKGRIKMEKAGLKFKGGSTRRLLAVELGLKPRDKHDKFCEALQAKMDAILAAMGAK